MRADRRRFCQSGVDLPLGDGKLRVYIRFKFKHYYRFVGESEMKPMRVLMPNGIRVMTVDSVIAISEKRPKFNGRVERLCEPAKEAGYANALAFFPAERNRDCFSTAGAVMIGNLPNEFVRSVIDSLMRTGTADFSEVKLQKAQPVASGYVFDNGGKAGAYMQEGYEVDMCCASVVGYPFMGGPRPKVSVESNEVDDAEEENEDDE